MIKKNGVDKKNEDETKENLGLITDKANAKYNQIKKEVGENEWVGIVPHYKADIDALAMALAIQFDLSLSEIESHIICNGSTSHPQNKAMITALQIKYEDAEFYTKNKDTCSKIITCDTPRINNALNEVDINLKIDASIDHHPDEEMSKNCLYINEDLGAGSTLMYFIYKKNNIEFTKEIATALYLGIYKDLKSLPPGKQPSDYDIEARDELHNLIDIDIYDYVINDAPLTRDFLKAGGIISVEDEVGTDMIIKGLKEINPTVSAVTAVEADTIMKDRSVAVCMVIAVMDGKYTIASTRIREDLDTNKFCQFVFKAKDRNDEGKSSAGGRPGAGGATILWTNDEIEDWQVADENEREVLFNVKLKKYRKRAVEYRKNIE